MIREEELTIIFQFGTLSSHLGVQAIQIVFARYGIPLTGFALDSGKQMSLLKAISRLERSHENNFNLTGQGFEFDLSPIRNSSLDRFTINSSTPSALPWDDWVAHFADNSNFIMAWVGDSEYDHWQNAYDPLQYSAVNKPYTHLPMKSNGQPYPLERTIIDTSANPGRRILRDGYVEVVGTPMWLGAQFWHLTHADQMQVENEPWLRVSRPLPHVTRLQAAEQCFVTAENGSGELQSKLRSILFPVDGCPTSRL